MRAVSFGKITLAAIFMAGLVLAVAPSASATTFGTCAFDAATNTLTVTEGPESSADHGGVDCNLKDVSSGLFSPGGNQFFSLTEPSASASEFPCSDRVDVTNNHVTMISDPRVPDHGLPCTPNRTQVPEVAVGNLGFGADLGTILALCSGRLTGGGNCTGTVTPVRLIVISDGPSAVVPEPGTITLLGTGLIGLAGLVRRRFRG